MVPVNRLNLAEKDGFTVYENVEQAEVPTTAKSDLPFVFRVEANSPTTCWPTSRMDIMALSQLDKKSWLKALKSLTSQSPKSEKYQTILRLEKNQVNIIKSCLFNYARN